MYQNWVSRREFVKGGIAGLAATTIATVDCTSTLVHSVSICWLKLNRNLLHSFAQDVRHAEFGRFTFFATVDEAVLLRDDLNALKQQGHCVGFRPKSHNYQAEYQIWQAGISTCDKSVAPPLVLGIRPNKALARFCAKNRLRLAVWLQIQSTLNCSHLSTPQLLNLSDYIETLRFLKSQQLSSVALTSHDAALPIAVSV